MKRICYLIFLLIFVPVFAGAQESAPAIEDLDSIQLVQALTDSLSDAAEHSDQSETKKEGEFLPVWMTVSDSFELRHVDAAKVKKLQEDDAFWYANAALKKEQEKEENERTPLIFHPAFQTIMWVLVIAGFITFLVIFLMNANVGIFRRDRLIHEPVTETDFDDIFSINYQQEIDKAVAAGQYNFAVRLLFLRLLLNLSERNIIDYKQDRTNFDYLMQLRQTRYYQDFFMLTRHYEYSWYGQFPLEKEKFDMVRNKFEQFDRNLN